MKKQLLLFYVALIRILLTSIVRFQGDNYFKVTQSTNKYTTVFLPGTNSIRSNYYLHAIRTKSPLTTPYDAKRTLILH